MEINADVQFLKDMREQILAAKNNINDEDFTQACYNIGYVTCKFDLLIEACEDEGSDEN